MERIGEQGKGFCWMMRDHSNDEVLGCIRLNSIDKRAPIAEIGYELGSQHWNKGFMTKALIAVTEHSHHQMSLYRLEAWTVTGNPASNRVLEKAGFS
ncbi:GNAT family N-acetyltransferase [Pseudovibrio sp. Ad13]|uniref:GNAT family N-acetyltransferase n=1 Tax=Pseudovibrio sp. Ad13 TaxID=989396 RepID=UPI0007AE6897|nr:GNAT family N-acetyltransferase [Pseudovibrio sp. Ad13]